MMDPREYKTIQHYEDAHHARELTFTCYHRRPFFADSRVCALLGESITNACARHRWSLIAFVFMPDHVHLLVRPHAADPDIAQLLHAIKRPVAYHARRLTPSVTHMNTPSFWQRGPGYDRNMWNPRVLRSAVEYIHANPLRKQLCMSLADWLWSSWPQWHAPREPLRHPSLPTIDRDALPHA